MNPFDDTPTYDEEAVQPMRDELVSVGFEELKTPESVDSYFKEDVPSAVVVINSVCGCAAGGARPGVSLALQNAKIPAKLGTVFAGQDKAAVRRLREQLSDFAPSSPFIAVMKNGKPVHVMERHNIEGLGPMEVAQALTAAFNAHCENAGPSISAEEFEKITGVNACGSSIPKNEG